MQIHLDAIGGVAGDMFVAALLDAFPEHKAGVCAAVQAVVAVDCTILEHNDGVFAGSRFEVSVAEAERDAHQDLHSDHPTHDHHGAHSHSGALHHHRHWSAIKADLAGAALEPLVRDHAVAIFTNLAEAEAKVHGIAVEDVAFHEVGAWDSIADIVAAAYLIARLGSDRWTIGPIPLGSGRVSTAHGLLPIPAPATALLLRGFASIDDGISGERVTPTGAAIIRHLCAGGGEREQGQGVRTIGRSGTGFGTRAMKGLSNCLRILVFDEAIVATPPSEHREIAVIEFEVDDQSAEDLAMGLDRLRSHQDVFDVVQMAVFGKKGRMMTHVRALARASAVDAAIAACFRETTTIGLRYQTMSGASLPRRTSVVEVAAQSVRVKIVDRPGGRTAKAEADDALTHETHAARASLRREAERLAILGDAES